MKAVVVFDVDDTLYHERDYVRSGFDAVGEWICRERRWQGVSEQLWAEFVAGRRGDTFDVVFSRFVDGAAELNDLVASAVQRYREHVPNIRLAADAELCLAQLVRITSLAAITDGSAISQRRKVERLGLARFMNPVILTEELGAEMAKPNPAAFLRVQEFFASESAFVYVGDNPHKDFVAPHSMGWTTVRIRRAGGLHCDAESGTDVDCEVDSLTDLLSLQRLARHVGAK